MFCSPDTRGITTASNRGSNQLDLRFTAHPDGRTWLANQHVAYPFHVGRCVTLPGNAPGMAAVLVQGCSGGIFEHDRLAWRIHADQYARVRVGTGAATIVHSMEQGIAEQSVHIEAGAHALVEYVPEPLILFPDAKLSNRLTIQADENASAFVWEAVLMHDPGRSHAEGRFAHLDSEWNIASRAGELWARDRLHATGTAMASRVPGVTGTYPCQATCAIVRRGFDWSALLEQIYARFKTAGEVYLGASRLPGKCGVLVRVLATDAAALVEVRDVIRRAARDALLTAPAAPVHV